MNELQSILDAWRQSGKAGESAVIATVVHVEGSAYRRPGARMFMLPNGMRVGTISGGCLEGDVSKKAWWLTEEGRPVVRIYDTTSEDDAVWEFGLGCNGVVKVLLERTEMDTAREALEFLDHCRRGRHAGVMATVIRASATCRFGVGDRLMLEHKGLWGGSLPRETELVSQAWEVLLEGKNRMVQFGDCDVFVEHIAPPVELTIFGAGHDAIPLVAIAKEIGWHVTVADGRPAYAKAERFPGADRVALLPRESVEIGRDSVVVLMTHNYPQDRDLLRRMLGLRPAYLGVLGPKKRTERLLGEIGAAETDAMHAPAGLDIGADTPQAIALSIVAEIQAVLANRPGSMLRLRTAPIYSPETVRQLVA